jgi:hypothetical protein
MLGNLSNFFKTFPEFGILSPGSRTSNSGIEPRRKNGDPMCDRVLRKFMDWTYLCFDCDLEEAFPAFPAEALESLEPKVEDICP